MNGKSFFQMAFHLFSRAKASISAASGFWVSHAGPPSRNAQGMASQNIVNSLNRAEAESEFLELPIDVLLEIFSHLEPIDLFHLSRVSKDLLRLLRSNDSLYIWTSAYANIPRSVQPPKCPDGVNVIHYTNFLYGGHCQFCASSRDLKYHMSVLIRFCPECRESRFIVRNVPLDEKLVHDLCNSWPFQNPHKDYILKAEYNLRRQELRRAMREDKLAEYTSTRKDEVTFRANHARDLEAWQIKVDKEKQLKMQLRELEIKKKLRDEGYGTLVCAFTHLQKLPQARGAKELTDLEWSCIRADVINQLQDDYESRQLFWIRRQLTSRLERLHKIVHNQLNVVRPQITPTEFHIASMEPFISFIKADINRLAFDVVKQFEPQLREFTANWKEEMDQYLIRLLPDVSEAESGKDRKRFLELGTTFFKCPMCADPVPYPQILMHECLVQVSGSSFREAEEEVRSQEKVVRECEDGSWETGPGERRESHSSQIPREPRPPKGITADAVWQSMSKTFGNDVQVGNIGITFHTHAHRAARNIIRACQEDPDTVTYAQMEKKEVRLGCLRCTQKTLHGNPRRLVMRWTSAIIHEIDLHYEEAASFSHSWELIESYEDLAKARQEESSNQKESNTFCLYCRTGQPQNRLQWHLVDTHEMEVGEMDALRHFYHDVRSPMRTLPNAVFIGPREIPVTLLWPNSSAKCGDWYVRYGRQAAMPITNVLSP